MRIPFFESGPGRLVAVLLVCFFCFFLHLGVQEVGLMESRNFVAAREMAGGGSWLLPSMNGELRLAKPPLPTWAVAGMMRVIGFPQQEQLFWLRLPAAVMSTLLVLFFWGLLWELTRGRPGEAEEPGRTAWLGALVLASSLLMVTVGRDAQWDIFSHGFMVGSLWLMVRAGSKADKGGLWALSGLLLGLSMLSKGPVALYGIWLPFLICYYQPRLWGESGRLRQEWRGLLLSVLVALTVGASWPWYIWQHVAAAALTVAQTEVSSWQGRHVQPFWYYFNFPVFTGVWAMVALVSLAVPYARRRATAYVPYLLGLVWLLVSVILLSVVPEKKERYMLPLMFPLVMLLTGLLRAWEIAARQQKLTQTDNRVLWAWGILLTLAGVALPAAMAVGGLPGFGMGSARFWAALLLGGLLAFGILRQTGHGKAPRPLRLILASIVLMAAGLAILMPAYPLWENRKAEAGLRRMTDVRREARWQHYAWRSLSEIQIKQVWAAGKSIPLLTHQNSPEMPFLLFSPAPVTKDALGEKGRNFQFQLVDSFFLGRNRKSEQWFVTLVK
ncbi:glycosyltransferase family 39 protein [Hymenobacter sp. BT730]|uniref:ArnT family glycosyltransferase n=1 Tax=Hymenobacter sp. BT730 TaxID=3063332 RepID=UPI0026E0FF97|nr:glycosyltransferase family 39 protein [Hymenobacter sp. BT730]